MSTEVFRKYIDILNEHTDAEIEQLNKALSNLETVLGKYKDKIFESVFEDDIPDPPFSSADGAPRTPKPRVKKGPDGKWLQQSPSGEWVPVETRPAPTSPEPTTADARARYRQSSSPVEPEPGPISKSASKVWDLTKTGAAKVADLAKKIPIPQGGLGKTLAGLGVTATLAAIAMYSDDIRNLIADYTRSIDFSKLPPADQEIIKTNWAVVEPYVTPNVIKTLPTDLQTRIANVINLLTRLGMAIKGYEGKSLLDRAKGLGDYVPFTVSWKNSSDAHSADPSKPPEKPTFDQLLQKASKNAQGVQESELSDVERMARLRDILVEDMTWTDPAKNWWAAFLSSNFGVSSAVAFSPPALELFSTLWLKYSADQVALGGSPATLTGLAKWILKSAKWKKWLITALVSGSATAIQLYGIKGALDAIKDVADSRGSDIDAEQAVIDAYETMTDEEYKALSAAQKIKLDQVLLNHCWNFPQKPNCMDMQKHMVKKHPDWALVQNILRAHPDWPEVKQVCQANPNLPGCKI